MKMHPNCLATVIVMMTALVSICAAEIPFTEHTVDDAFIGACSICAADVDGNETLDILSTGLYCNTVAWWANDGGDPITWTCQTVDANFNGAINVNAADVNGDGDTDILGAAWYANEIAWWRNEGGSPLLWTKFTIDSDFGNAHEVRGIDIDDDGDMDIVGAAAGDNDICLWYNGGGSPIQWTEQVIDNNFTGARSVYPIDIDGDQDIDLVGAAYEADQVAWWKNTGGNPITWVKYSIDANFGGAHMVHAYDIDCDGDNDVLCAGYNCHQIAWWRNDGGDPVQWNKQTIRHYFFGALGVRAADIDGDGDGDVIGASESARGYCLWINEGGTIMQWTEQAIDSTYLGAWPVFTTDLDQDGDVDVLGASNYTNRITWWENVGTPSAVATLQIPEKHNVICSYPNPFNPRTNLTFTVPARTGVALEVYDIGGKHVATLLDGSCAPGIHNVIFDGSDLASGPYFYHLVTENSIATGKMVLLK